MKSRIILLCIMVTILLTGCTRASLGAELALCASYAVPGMHLSDLKGDTFNCTVLEEDSYGRILYSYTTISIITGEKETAFVICQKIDGNYVYFYEDICYMFEDDTEELVHILKKRNDWGLPINIEMCSRRKNKISLSSTIITDADYWQSELMDIFSHSFSMNQNQIKDFCFLDEDYSGNSLYWVKISQDCVDNQYFVIIGPRCTASLMKITENYAYWEELPQFKKNNGWMYGFKQ